MGLKKVEKYYTSPASVFLPSSRHLSIVFYAHYYSCAVLSFFTLVQLLVQSFTLYLYRSTSKTKLLHRIHHHASHTNAPPGKRHSDTSHALSLLETPLLGR